MHPSQSTTARPRRGGKATSPGYHRGKRPPNYGMELPAEVYTPAEMRRVFDAFPKSAGGVRNQAITALLYRCGLRISEAIKAPLGDLSIEDRTLFVRHPKRDRKGRVRQRLVAVDEQARHRCSARSRLRRVLGISDNGVPRCVACSPCTGEPMQASGYREALKTVGLKAHIAKRMHPHGLRHTFAFDWLQEGRPLDQLQVLLGHRHLSTTAHYAQHLNPKVALDAQRGRSWGAAPVAGATPDLESILRTALAQLLPT